MLANSSPWILPAERSLIIFVKNGIPESFFVMELNCFIVLCFRCAQDLLLGWIVLMN